MPPSGKSASAAKTALSTKKGKAKGGKSGTPEVLSAEQKGKKLPGMLKALKERGLAPAQATDRFCIFKNDAYHILPSTLVSLKAPKYRHDLAVADPAKCKQLLIDAEGERNKRNPLRIRLNEGVFNDEYRADYECDPFDFAPSPDEPNLTDGGDPLCPKEILAGYIGHVALHPTKTDDLTLFAINFLIKGNLSQPKEKPTDDAPDADKEEYDRHRRLFRLSLSRMHLLYPEAVDPCFDADGNAFAAGEIAEAMSKGVEPKPLRAAPAPEDPAKPSADDLRSPNLVFYAGIESVTRQDGSWGLDPKRMYIAHPSIIALIIDHIRKYELVDEFPAIANLNPNRSKYHLDLAKVRQAGIDALGAPPAQLTDEGEFEPEWAQKRRALPFGKAWFDNPKAGEEDQPALVPYAKDLRLPGDNLLWRNPAEHKADNFDYYAQVVAQVYYVGMGEVFKPERGRAAREQHELKLREDMRALEAENAAVKAKLAKLRGVNSALKLQLNVGVSDAAPMDKRVKFHGELSQFTIARAVPGVTLLEDHAPTPSVKRGFGSVYVDNFAFISSDPKSGSSIWVAAFSSPPPAACAGP